MWAHEWVWAHDETLSPVGVRLNAGKQDAQPLFVAVASVYRVAAVLGPASLPIGSTQHCGQHTVVAMVVQANMILDQCMYSTNA